MLKLFFQKIPATIWVAIAVVALGVIWILSGNNQVIIAGDKHNDVKKINPNPEPLIQKQVAVKVKMEEVIAQKFTPEFTTNGISQPNKIVSVKSAIGARVQQKNFKEYERVKQGDLLVQFEPQTYPAMLKSAEELVNLRTQQYESTKKLFEQGYASNINLTQITTELANARAQLAEQQRVNGELKVFAPFDGVVYQSMVENGDLVGVGQPLLQLASLNPIYVDIDIPASQLQQMAGVTRAKLQYNNQIIHGELLNISETGDVATRTMRVRFSAPNPNHTIKGQVGVMVSLLLPTANAHKLKKSVLGLNDAGVLGVKLVNNDNIVEFIAVKTLSEEGDFIWVSGLPAKVKVITEGGAFVNNGTKVEVGE